MSNIPPSDPTLQDLRTHEKLHGLAVWLHTQPGRYEVVAVLATGRVRVRPWGDKGYLHTTFHNRSELVLPFSLE